MLKKAFGAGLLVACGYAVADNTADTIMYNKAKKWVGFWGPYVWWRQLTASLRFTCLAHAYVWLAGPTHISTICSLALQAAG
jgi:hypothetical protein